LGFMFVAILPIAMTVDDAAWALALYGFVLFRGVGDRASGAHRWYRVRAPIVRLQQFPSVLRT